MRHPESVERIAILNGPHPIRMALGLLHPLQLLRSWYMFFFQLPRLPELLAQRNGWALLLEPLEHIPVAADWASHEHEAYRRAFQQPGALHAMINYRAMFRAGGPVSLRRVDAPVLVRLIAFLKEPATGTTRQRPSRAAS
jgi:pimeloyl-ACP methyl ester carboxylesterase